MEKRFEAIAKLWLERKCSGDNYSYRTEVSVKQGKETSATVTGLVLWRMRLFKDNLFS